MPTFSAARMTSVPLGTSISMPSMVDGDEVLRRRGAVVDGLGR